MGALTKESGDKDENEKPELIFISRAQWAAPLPKWNGEPERLRVPVLNVLCTYTLEWPCFNKAACLKEMLNLARIHRKNNKYPDIKYNFVIGNDGRVYEGRGWKVRPDTYRNIHLEKERTLYIGLTGLLHRGETPKKVFSVRDQLILYGIEHNYILPDYKLYSSIDRFR